MKLKVVIVEDELPLLRELTETFPWRSVNCEVCGTASNLSEARIVLAETRPDILITDIKLPDGEGLSLLEEPLYQSAIVITGFSYIEYAQKALRAGAVDFILKPVDDEELRQALQRAVIKLLGGNSKAVRFSDTQADADARADADAQADIDAQADADAHADTNARADADAHADTYNALVYEALMFIQKYYQNDVSLFEAARHLDITEGHLASIFKKETGKTFVQVLTEQRMAAARTLLCDPRNRIKEVADQCGYNDSAYFAKVFRRVVGLSPREYRSRL